MAGARLSSSWALTLRIFSLNVFVVLLSCLPILPIAINSPFFTWALDKSLCPARLVFFLTGFSFGTWGQPAPAPFGFPSWGASSLPDQACLTKNSVNQASKEAKVYPPEVQDGSSSNPHPYLSHNKKLSFCDRYAQDDLPITSPTSPSLFTKNWFSGAPSLDCSLTNCVRKLCSTHFRNLLDCFVSAVFYFQQTSGKLKSPMRTRAVSHETSPSCL